MSKVPARPMPRTAKGMHISNAHHPAWRVVILRPLLDFNRFTAWAPGVAFSEQDNSFPTWREAMDYACQQASKEGAHVVVQGR